MVKFLKQSGIWFLALVLALLIIAAPLRLTATTLSYSNMLKNGNLCARAIAKEERRSGIPNKLLYALSIKESGRWIKKEQANITWPWTVNAGGVGKYFNSRREAVKHVRNLQKKGQKNIDIGCMQINLHYHPSAFKSLESGFEPTKNVAYAAKFLTALKEVHGSWHLAVRYYHSANQTKSKPYQNKVFQIWNSSLGNKKARIWDEKSRGHSLVAKNSQTTHQKPKRSDSKFFAELRRKFPNRFDTRNKSGTPNRFFKATHLIGKWPPRDYAAQRRAEYLARARSFSKRIFMPPELSP